MKSCAKSRRNALLVACGGMLALLMPSRCFHAQDEKRVDPFERTVQTFSLDRQTVFEAIARLHEATGVVVSVERPLTATQVSQPDQEFTATIAGAKPDVVLDEICALDGRCTWTRDGNMVNIYPLKVKADPNYVFNRKISVFQLDSVADAGTAAIRAIRETTGPPAFFIGTSKPVRKIGERKNRGIIGKETCCDQPAGLSGAGWRVARPAWFARVGIPGYKPVTLLWAGESPHELLLLPMVSVTDTRLTNIKPSFVIDINKPFG